MNKLLVLFIVLCIVLNIMYCIIYYVYIMISITKQSIMNKVLVFK